jgi:hypothetical protein
VSAAASLTTIPKLCAKAADVTRRTALARQLVRDAFLVLATLAIALKIMIPAGFMPGMDQPGSLPFALVICTGEGLKVVDQLPASHQSDEHGGKSAHDAPCPFAVQGAATPPPAMVAVARAQVVTYVEPLSPLGRTVAPGQGLAAPPPPPTGPPIALI